MVTKRQIPVVSTTKICTECDETNKAFYPKRGICAPCYNAQCVAARKTRKNVASGDEDKDTEKTPSAKFAEHSNEQAEAFTKMQAEMDELRKIVSGLHNSNTLLHNENKELQGLLKKQEADKSNALAKMQIQIKELMHESKKQANFLQIDSLAEMHLEILELQAENRELRGFLQKPKKADVDDSLVSLRAEIKEVREKNKCLEEALRAQDSRIEGVVHIQNEMQFVAPPKYSPDIVSDWEHRCDRIEKSLGDTDKKLSEHIKKADGDIDALKSATRDPKTGNKAIANKIDALTISIAQFEDPENSLLKSPKTVRKSGVPKK